MYVLTHCGTGHRSHRRQIALVLLSALLSSCATVAVAGTSETEDTVERLERFAFTGTYRFKLTPTAAPRTSHKPDVKRIVVAPPSQPASRQTDQPARDRLGPRRMPETPSVTVATPARSSTPAAVTGGTAPATVYIVPRRKTKNAIVSRRPIETASPAKPSTQTATRSVRLTTPPKAPLSRDTRSSLGAAPGDTLNAIAMKPAPDQVAKAAQRSLPVVRIAVSTPATSADARDPQAVTLQPSGRAIYVPPLPALYRRPAGTAQTRNNGLAHRSKRIAKRATKPQRPKSAQSKPASIFDAQPAWADSALFKSD